MMEPAAYGASVMFGPHIANFRETVDQLLKHNAARQVADAAELTRGLMADLDDPEAAAARGAAGSRLCAGSARGCGTNACGAGSAGGIVAGGGGWLDNRHVERASRGPMAIHPLLHAGRFLRPRQRPNLPPAPASSTDATRRTKDFENSLSRVGRPARV